MKAAVIIFITYVFGGFASYAKAACQTIPPAADSAPIAFCEARSTLSVRVGEQERDYAKDAFIAAWQDLAAAWLGAEGLDPGLLAGADVEYWFSVPEANPLAAQIRLQVSLEDGRRFLLAGSPFPEEWPAVPTRSQIAVLKNGVYPNDFGFRPGELLVQSRPNVDPQDMLEHLQRFSKGEPQRSGGSWYVLPTTALDEARVSRMVQSDAKTAQLVQELFFNTLYEWIAYRERAFAFSFE